MTWNSGPMIGGGTNWPRLNRSGFWVRRGPGEALEVVDDLTDDATVDDLDDESDGGDQDVPGTGER